MVTEQRMPHFEDALVAQRATRVKADCVVTRNLDAIYYKGKSGTFKNLIHPDKRALAEYLIDSQHRGSMATHNRLSSRLAVSRALAAVNSTPSQKKSIQASQSPSIPRLIYFPYSTIV